MRSFVRVVGPVYDVARRDTFENLDLWLQEVEVYSPAGGRDVVKLLVGNKIDKVRPLGACSVGLATNVAEERQRLGEDENSYMRLCGRSAW